MFSILFALTTLTAPTAAPDAPLGWAPQTVPVADSLQGLDVVVSESGAWVQRTAVYGGQGKGGAMRGDAYMEDEGMPAPSHMSRPKSRPSRSSKAEAFGGAAVRQQVAGLKAGSTDDNEAFGAYLEFLATWKGRSGQTGAAVQLPVADREYVTVTTGDGQPVPGARFLVRQGKEVVWSGRTFGDGRAPFYPKMAGVSAEGLTIEVGHGGQIARTAWNRGGTEVALERFKRSEKVALDVVFVIDTTGSMSDEIERVKATLLEVTADVRALETPVDLRYGAVLYRDIGDEYLTRHTPLTSDLQRFDGLIKEVQAGGGGDGPESLNQGMAVAVSKMDWRDDAAKLMFVVADAEPHMDYAGDTTYAQASWAAMNAGIRVHTVAASGLGDFGSLAFRQSAQLTEGKFIFIEYGSTAASAADHGVTGPVASNNLDAILLEEIRSEVLGWGQRAEQVAAR